jgi:D-alanine-D-alanine ligase
VFIILHGKGGEDGEIQSYLDILKIPYTGSNKKSSEICMNKRSAKKILLDSNIATPKFKRINAETSAEDIESLFKYPIVIKPTSEGSSIGVYIVENREDLKNAILNNKKISDDIIAEQYIKGIEYTVAILNKIALPVIKLIPPGQFYDYEAKYNSVDTKYICPSGLDENTEAKLKNTSLKSFEVLNCNGWGRVDIILDKNNKPWVIELNTVPGMTEHSLVPMAAEAENIGFNNLVLKILDTSFK